MERWNRAEKHGLNPSNEVKQIIESHNKDQRYIQWYVYSYIEIMFLGCYCITYSGFHRSTEQRI